MPKEFHNWVSDLSNSIPDSNTYLDPKPELTEWQIRCLFASLLVPDLSKEDSGYAWMQVFVTSVCEESNEMYTDGLLTSTLEQKIGAELSREWLETDEDEVWINRLKNIIMSTGQLPRSLL